MTTNEAHCPTCRCHSVTQETLDRREADAALVDRWLDADVDFGMPGRIYRRYLWRAMDVWCRAENLETPSPQALYDRLRLLGHREVKVRGVYYFEGIAIRKMVDLCAATVDAPTAEAVADET